jgi:hypothetical protein
MGTVEPLRDIEEIRQVKHRFLRCIDLKLWDELGDTLTEGSILGTGMSAFGKPEEITGRPDIVAFLRARLGPGVLTGHTAGQPEIAVDGDTATGIWFHRETVLATKHRIVTTSAGFWEDRYERGGDARWRIARASSARIYEVLVSLDDLPSFKVVAALGSELPKSAYPYAELSVDLTSAHGQA